MARTPLLRRLSRAIRRTAPEAPALEGLREGLSRREIVQLGLLAGAAPALGCRSSADRTVVIGAGIAGLHCAYRLAEAGVDVTVYEASSRVGGRMWTGRGLFAGGLQCELGGELIDTNHLTLHELAEELDIPLDDRLAHLPAGTLPDTWYAGGRTVPEDEIVAQFVAVAPAIAAAFDEAEATDAGYAELDTTPLSVFLDATVGEQPELHAILTAAYRGEFGLETDRQSCLNLVYLIDALTPDPFRIFGDSDERYRAHDGNDTFPTRLAAGIEPERIVLGHRLVAVRDRGARYEVELVDASGGRVVDEADHVVFALPFSTLREVALETEDLTAEKRRIVAELGYGTNAKVMGGFSRRPWLEDHGASGSITSDLAMQQAWDTTVGQDGGGAGVLTNFLGGEIGAAAGEGTELVRFEAALGDLDRVFPGAAAAFDGTAVRMHWPTHQHTLGSYTCYLPGQWAFWGQEGRRNRNLHFCGEHTSLDFQGWMEGGAETGALVAAEILDDLGVARSEGLARVVAAKTLVPQACYHGDRLPAQLRPRARREALARRVRALLR